MNFPSPTQALQARAQPGGITPELIRLLAQMKVKQETDAAARDMAMKSGMQPPTVADSVNAELEGNARQKIEQKLGGLQALSQRQAPQGAPTMPAPPEQPTQHMAAGGLARMKSNLPTRYAGGGIVAFSAGDEVKIPDGGYAPEAEEEVGSQMSYTEQIKRLMGAIPGIPYAAAKSLADKMADIKKAEPERIVTGTIRRLVSAPKVPEPQQVAAPVPDTRDPNYGADALGLPRSNTPPPPPAGANVPASGKNAGVAAIPQTVVPTPAPLSPVEKAMNDALGRNGTAEETAARAAAQARLEAALGGDQAALRAAKQQDYEQAKAAQAARDAKGELSIWDRLGTLGQNAAYGNWGRAAGQQRNMELSQEERKAEGAKGLLALKQASDAALLNDKIKAFDFAEGKGGEALKAAAEAQKNAMGDASRLLAQRGQDAAHIQGIGMTNATQLKVAQIQAASHVNELAQRRMDNMDAKAAQAYARTHDLAMKQATDASNKFAESLVGGVTRPGETPESVFTKVYNQAMMTVPGYVPIKNAVAGAGIDLSKFTSTKIKG